MSRWHAWVLHLGATVVTITGLAYYAMREWMQTGDPFSVVNHPLQPLMLKLHLAAAPLLVFAVGLIMDAHIARNLRRGAPANRLTGLAAMAAFALMTASGYGLQIVSSPVLSRLMLWTHLSSGILFASSYAAHQVRSFRILRDLRTAPARVRNLDSGLTTR